MIGKGFPHEGTRAATMLRQGIFVAQAEKKLSIRSIAKLMDYGTGAVISHMASGRVPIPIDRAEQFAEILSLPKQAFVLAVLQQRHPDVEWDAYLSEREDPHAEANFIATMNIPRGPSAALTAEQKGVISEVAAEPRPRRRWLSINEVPTIELLRQQRPSITTEGLTDEEYRRIAEVLTVLADEQPQ